MSKTTATLEQAQELAARLGYKIEPAGLRHAYVNACAEIPPPRYVVRNIKPGYDLYHCRTQSELLAWLIDREMQLNDAYENAQGVKDYESE